MFPNCYQFQAPMFPQAPKFPTSASDLIVLGRPNALHGEFTDLGGAWRRRNRFGAELTLNTRSHLPRHESSETEYNETTLRTPQVCRSRS